MAKKVYKTMRGRPIDMGALAAANSEKIAIGNAKMNARGDLLGPNGIVLRTQEQVEAEWLRNQQRQQETAGISNNIKAPLPPDRLPTNAFLEDQFGNLIFKIFQFFTAATNNQTSPRNY